MKKGEIIISVFLVFIIVTAFYFSFLIATPLVMNTSSVGSLLGKVILIDPGHGGKDNGTSYDNLLEDEINLSIGLKMYENLIEEGAYTLISRNNDYDLADMYASNRKNQDLKRRVNFINNSNVDLFISIHMNSYSLDNNVQGAQVFYQINNEKSKELAQTIQKELNIYNRKEKEAKKGDYYILNNSHPLGVIVELAFLTNQEDRLNILKKEYQLKLIKSIKKGILNYYQKI